MRTVTFSLNLIYSISHLYFLYKLSLLFHSLLDNGAKMISLIFIVNCISKFNLIRIWEKWHILSFNSKLFIYIFSEGVDYSILQTTKISKKKKKKKKKNQNQKKKIIIKSKRFWRAPRGPAMLMFNLTAYQQVELSAMANVICVRIRISLQCSYSLDVFFNFYCCH